MDLVSLLKKVAPLNMAMTVGEVADRLMTVENQRYLCLPVVDDFNVPIGLVSRYKLQDIFLKRYGRDLWERRSVLEIMNSTPLLISLDMGLEEAADAVTAQLQYPITEDFILIEKDGTYLGLGMVMDLTRAMARYLSRNRQVLIRAQQIAGLGSWEWNARSDIIYWSPQITPFIGVKTTLTHAPLRDVISIFTAESQEKLISFFHPSSRYLEHLPTLELKLQSADGELRFFELQGEHFNDPETGEHHAVGTLLDITERRISEERLAQLANFDHLTKLPNRYLFQDRLRHAITQSLRKDSSVALLFLDIDRFKWINDALGHAAGDELLKQVAHRLTSLLRSSDTVARLGGDEFTVILENVTDSEQVAVVAEKIISSFAEKFNLDDRQVSVSTSIGIALCPSDADTIDALLKGADRAMYQAKSLGRNRYCFYTTELDREERRRFELERRLQNALEKGEFELYFQPQLDTQSSRLISAEALLRWVTHNESISPAEFIPLMESSQLIVPVGRWVLKQACLAAALWQKNGLKGVGVAVNLSVFQLRQPDFVAMVEATLAETRLSPGLLVVEVTESVLLDDQGSADALLKLSRLGVKVAIDDFGTGYSSLVYLKRFAVDTLKLDRTFVTGLTNNVDDDAIAIAVITLAHSLGLTVTAEGVETLTQQQFLRDQKCDHLQGYLISSPLPEKEFVSWALTKHASLIDSFTPYDEVYPLIKLQA
ncbi:EAL domain-containing protein [Pseudomonas duriflava]|nr:EAL domain-containing protein [Pseudomonas duriflava]